MTAIKIVNKLLETDDLSKDQLIQMGRQGDCQELCHCGAYCTLIHYRLEPSGVMMPQYHICKTCDLDTAKVEESVVDKKAELAVALSHFLKQSIAAEDLNILSDREVLVMYHRYFQGENFNEIATRFNCNRHKITRLAMQAQQKLHRLFHPTPLDQIKEADDPEMARIRKRVEKAKATRLAQDPATQALDDPTAFVQREVERRAEPIKKLEVYGRRWYRRGPGGVYCTASIYINDKLVHTTPMQYGYGDHYLTLAKNWLMRNGYLVGLLDDERDPLWTIRDKHGIPLNYSVTDVSRQRDL